MPEKKFIYEEDYNLTDIETILYTEGYNVCIDEILGEKGEECYE